MRLMDMDSHEMWHLMLDYYNFYTDEDYYTLHQEEDEDDGEFKEN